MVLVLVLVLVLVCYCWQYGHRQTQEKTPALKIRVLCPIRLLILKKCSFASSFVSFCL